MTTPSTPTASRTDWDAAATRTIFFGHQSIGDNIVDGLRQIAKAKSWPELKIVDVAKAAPAGGPALLHAAVGQNGNPESKLTDFRRMLDGGVGRQVDVALVKLCFWDVRRDTDIDALFKTYRTTFDELGRAYPNVTFVHTTVPLVVADRDWRARTRRMLGLGVPTDADNKTRAALNTRIRETYGRDHVLFDIAALEDTAQNTDIPYLANELSSDGAHLNDAGRQRLAAGFVKSLSAVAAAPAAVPAAQ